jgi:hypothetical protein
VQEKITDRDRVARPRNAICRFNLRIAEVRLLLQQQYQPDAPYLKISAQLRVPHASGICEAVTMRLDVAICVRLVTRVLAANGVVSYGKMITQHAGVVVT